MSAAAIGPPSDQSAVGFGFGFGTGTRPVAVLFGRDSASPSLVGLVSFCELADPEPNTALSDRNVEEELLMVTAKLLNVADRPIEPLIPLFQSLTASSLLHTF